MLFISLAFLNRINYKKSDKNRRRRKSKVEENWFNKTVDETVKKLDTNATTGLSKEQVSKRQEQYGFNELKAAKKKSLFITSLWN